MPSLIAWDTTVAFIPSLQYPPFQDHNSIKMISCTSFHIIVNCKDTCTKNAALFLLLLPDIFKCHSPVYAMQQSTVVLLTQKWHYFRSKAGGAS